MARPSVRTLNSAHLIRLDRCSCFPFPRFLALATSTSTRFPANRLDLNHDNGFYLCRKPTIGRNMAFDTLRIIAHGITWFIPYILRAGLQSLYATYHFYTYKPTDSPKHIVVIGGSFAGLQLVKRLTQTIPSGYKIIWLEKNSHLNYVFAFPRFSVVAGLEERAFIPYTALEAGAPNGSLRRVQGTVSWVNRDEQKVILDSGEEFPFSYLAIATGSTQPLPVQVESTERTDACDELRAVQTHIKTSQKIAILGGGAVGVELASDIKDFYPDKGVTLVHSRASLLNRFGPKLQEYALRALRDELGVRVLLGERPLRPTAYGKGSLARDATLVFRDGKEEIFDLVIGCTGQRPNSHILAMSYPDSICEKSSRILVSPTLQMLTSDASTISNPDTAQHPDLTPPTVNPSERIFALGDVAAHPGPLMARAGFMQAETVVQNILSLINGQPAKKIYKPNWFIEGAIKLTLGKTDNVVYSREASEGGSEAMIVSRKGKEDLDIGMAWRQYGVSGEFERVKGGKLH
ncbi:hypothetical protein BJX62DRAFT_203575 [Aspergillus germanicus]